MLAFTWWSEVHEYAETPANRVAGSFCALLEDVQARPHPQRAGRFLWQILFDHESDRAYATARSPRPCCPNDCDPFVVEAAAAIWNSRDSLSARQTFDSATIPISEAEIRAGLTLADYYRDVRDNHRRCAGVPAY